MSVLSSDLAAPAPVPVGDWMPARWTRPLGGDVGEAFPSQGDKLLRAVGRHWRSPETTTFSLDEWQAWLLRHVLEVYPRDWPVVELRGQLRYRQVVISLGRQNGKSVIGALLAFYFLVLHVRGPRVVSWASVESQARIVYDRVYFAIDNSPALKAEIRPTTTRGIWRRDNTGVYKTLPAKEETAQGEPITGGIYDELHLGNLALWEAIVLGQSAKLNSLLVGITTAGDDDSELLIKLYLDGEAALAGEDERFGFFVWEAADDELTEANVIRANPAVACGRVPLVTKMADARKTWRAPKDRSGVLGRDRVTRYVLNRFVRGSATSWAPLDLWEAGAGDGLPADATDVVYALDRHEWAHAAITATTRRAGVTYSELVASLVEPSHAELVELCERLGGQAGVSAAFAMPADTLGALARELRAKGFDVWQLAAPEMAQASAAALGAIQRGQLRHAGDELLAQQMPRAKRRDTGDTWRVSRSLSSGDVDGVVATIVGVYVAEQRAETGGQLF